MTVVTIKNNFLATFEVIDRFFPVMLPNNQATISTTIVLKADVDQNLKDIMLICIIINIASKIEATKHTYSIPLLQNQLVTHLSFKMKKCFHIMKLLENLKCIAKTK